MRHRLRSDVHCLRHNAERDPGASGGSDKGHKKSQEPVTGGPGFCGGGKARDQAATTMRWGFSGLGAASVAGAATASPSYMAQ